MMRAHFAILLACVLLPVKSRATDSIPHVEGMLDLWKMQDPMPIAGHNGYCLSFISTDKTVHLVPCEANVDVRRKQRFYFNTSTEQLLLQYSNECLQFHEGVHDDKVTVGSCNVTDKFPKATKWYRDQQGRIHSQVNDGCFTAVTCSVYIMECSPAVPQQMFTNHPETAEAMIANQTALIQALIDEQREKNARDRENQKRVEVVDVVDNHATKPKIVTITVNEENGVRQTVDLGDGNTAQVLIDQTTTEPVSTAIVEEKEDGTISEEEETTSEKKQEENTDQDEENSADFNTAQIMIDELTPEPVSTATTKEKEEEETEEATGGGLLSWLTGSGSKKQEPSAELAKKEEEETSDEEETTSEEKQEKNTNTRSLTETNGDTGTGLLRGKQPGTYQR